MSKIKAALIVALLGSSTAAMASPSLTFSANAQANWSFGTNTPSAPIVRDHSDNQYTAPAPFVRDHRDEQAYQMPVNRWTSWISLGAPMSLADGRDVIRPATNMNITQVRLQANSGMSYVQKVTIRFTDGTRQNVMLNKWLTTRAPMLQFDLAANHRGIDSITVMGTTSGYNATYQVFAQGSRTVELPHPAQPPVYQPPVYQPPVYRGALLADHIDFAHTDGHTYTVVGAEKGAFSTIRIQGMTGSTYVEGAVIVFANGQQQALPAIDRTLRAGESVDLDLSGVGPQGIKWITVNTHDNGQLVETATGSFDILAF